MISVARAAVTTAIAATVTTAITTAIAATVTVAALTTAAAVTALAAALAAAVTTLAAAFTATTALAATEAAACAARTTWGLGLGLADAQRPTVAISAVGRLDGFEAFLAVGHGDEPETTAASGVAIAHDFGAGDFAVLREEIGQALIIKRPWQVADIEFHRDLETRTAVGP